MDYWGPIIIKKPFVFIQKIYEKQCANFTHCFPHEALLLKNISDMPTNNRTSTGRFYLKKDQIAEVKTP
jgi:hypothetical protein